LDANSVYDVTNASTHSADSCLGIAVSTRAGSVGYLTLRALSLSLFAASIRSVAALCKAINYVGQKFMNDEEINTTFITH
jgi:hypothetical protein